MGTWGPGPFDNDAAADFLDALATGPARAVAGALRRIAKTPAGESIDVDDGGAAWAACELVALALGHGDAAAAGDALLESAGRLRPKDDQRRLAIDVVARIADPATSELAALWHEGDDGAKLDASLASLRARLEAAGNGARAVPKAKTGDVIVVPAASDATGLVVVQVVGPGEVAVFEGTCADDAAALDAVKSRPARRVPASVKELFGCGRAIGSVRVRKDLKGKKLYASQGGSIDDYFLSTANAGGMRASSYEETRDCDVLHRHRLEDLRAIALGTSPARRVRSPDEREAERAAREATSWAARREATTPGPFGDLEILEDLLTWIETYGVENAVQSFHWEATGATGYGRPNEHSERRSYAFAALVALWRETWPRDRWPASLQDRLPAAPKAALMEQAVGDARTLAGRVITRDAELRLIWERAPDRGAALHASVAELEKALG